MLEPPPSKATVDYYETDQNESSYFDYQSDDIALPQ